MDLYIAIIILYFAILTMQLLMLRHTCQRPSKKPWLLLFVFELGFMAFIFAAGKYHDYYVGDVSIKYFGSGSHMYLSSFSHELINIAKVMLQGGIFAVSLVSCAIISCGRRKWLKASSLICCLAVLLTAFACFRIEYPWKLVYSEAEYDPSKGNMAMRIQESQAWDEIPDWEKYTYLEYNGITYDQRSKYISYDEWERVIIEEDKLKDSMGTVIAKCWDSHGTEYSTELALREVNEVSPNCAVAVKYESGEDWYIFGNSYYRPETLGQFIEDLNFEENVIFNNVNMSSWRRPISGDYALPRFEIDSEKVWELLLSETDAVNTHDDLAVEPGKVLGISVDVPLMAQQNISLSVLEDGYIKTNIMDTGKLFYIGEDKTEAFVDYVLKECEGFEYYSFFTISYME